MDRWWLGCNGSALPLGLSPAGNGYEENSIMGELHIEVLCG